MYDNDAGQNASEGIRTGLNGINRAASAGSKAARFGKAIKQGKGVKKALSASKVAKVFPLRWKIYILLGIFFLLLIIGIITTLPSIISNHSLHQNDPEILASEGNLDYYGTADEDQNGFAESNNKIDAEIRAILATALTHAEDSIKKDYRFSLSNYHLEETIYPSQSTEEEIISLYALYSASVKNGLSEESFELYQSTDGGAAGLTAIQDFKNKVTPLATQDSTIYDYGNVIYGADFVKDENGGVAYRTEILMVSDPATGLEFEETHYYFKIEIKPLALEEIALHAFGFSLTDEYDPDVAPYVTYYQRVADMTYVCGTTLYGNDFWKDKDAAFFPSIMGTSNAAIVNVALSQRGNYGGETYWDWWGHKKRVEWCAIFVSWCADKCGFLESGVIPKFQGCWAGANLFRQKGQLVYARSTYVPQPGNIVFFDWEDEETHIRDGLPDHVGIVVSVQDGTLYTVEGNSGKYPGRVREKTYSLESPSLLYYAVPVYPQSQTSQQTASRGDS